MDAPDLEARVASLEASLANVAAELREARREVARLGAIVSPPPSASRRAADARLAAKEEPEWASFFTDVVGSYGPSALLAATAASLGASPSEEGDQLLLERVREWAARCWEIDGRGVRPSLREALVDAKGWARLRWLLAPAVPAPPDAAELLAGRAFYVGLRTCSPHALVEVAAKAARLRWAPYESSRQDTALVDRLRGWREGAMTSKWGYEALPCFVGSGEARMRLRELLPPALGGLAE